MTGERNITGERKEQMDTAHQTITNPSQPSNPSHPNLNVRDQVTSSVNGVFFDGFSSRDHDATLQLNPSSLALNVPSLPLQQVWRTEQVQIDPPIPGVRRVLKFPDGSRFETRDDAAISCWERQSGKNRSTSLVRGLESRWSTALISLLVAVAGIAAFVQFGIPALATRAAHATPQSVLETFDRETIQLLEDKNYVGPSTLSAARQQQLQTEFQKVVQWAGGAYPYRLLIRNGEPATPITSNTTDDSSSDGSDLPTNAIGANAFALPNGTIVMTDQLIEMAQDDRELIGVLAHEAGHVKHRHGLAGVYQALGLTLVTTVFTGDLISSSTFAATVPAAILRSGYSRAAETQSDEVAGDFMMQKYGTTKPLQDILSRMEAEGDHSAPSIFDLLSTHPGTPKRIEHLKEIEQNNTP